MAFMAMTAQVKSELTSIQVTKPCCRKAEVSSILRFAGGLHLVSGRIVVEAELDSGAAARRLRKGIAEIFGRPADGGGNCPSGLRKPTKYGGLVVPDGGALGGDDGL